jgi:membrane-associated PAP2 superfamily phosphatase
MRLIGVLAIITWAMSHFRERLTPHRAALGYFAACMVVVPLTVGLLKQVTNVDCPWDLQGFGGSLPVVHWFEARPSGLPHAACFPGAHSSSAFALFALFFLWQGSRPHLAWVALAGTAALGALFSVAQQSRGAHFLSHDVASALIAWLMCYALVRVIRPGDRTEARP